MTYTHRPLLEAQAEIAAAHRVIADVRRQVVKDQIAQLQMPEVDHFIPAKSTIVDIEAN